jgi:hypothetical protein
VRASLEALSPRASLADAHLFARAEEGNDAGSVAWMALREAQEVGLIELN